MDPILQGPGEGVGVVIEGLVGESLDAAGEAVPVDVRPVDPAVWWVGVVFDGELHELGDVVVGEPATRNGVSVATGSRFSATTTT